MHERKAEMISVEIFDSFGKKVLSIDRSVGEVVVPLEQRFFELSKPMIQLTRAENGERILLLVGPIFENNDQEKPIGVIVGILDVSLIDRVLLSRSGLGESGETYLVNENKMLISESRFIEDAAFDVEVDTLGVRQCLENGKEIEDVYDDYRGIKIHGVTYCAPDLGWVLLAEIDDQEVNAPLVHLTYIFIIVGIIITLIFSGLAAYLIRKTILPILELTKATSEVIKGNFDVKVNPKSNDEIGNLQKHFNDMIHAIKTSESHVKKLKEIDEQKDEFVSMVSHELKTPLVPIGLYCQLLLGGKYGDLNEKQLKAIKTISQSNETLTELVKDFLDINRIELKRLELDKQEIDLKEFLEETIEFLKPFTVEKNIDLNLEIKRDWKIKCDQKRITQVIFNLVKNAVDFVPEKNGKITIRAQYDDNLDTIISVQDNGKGIDPKDHKNLFTKFYHAGDSTKRRFGGTGLGLTICQGIVETHGGKIWVQSKEGKGTIFFFIIPKDD